MTQKKVCETCGIVISKRSIGKHNRKNRCDIQHIRKTIKDAMKEKENKERRR